MKEITAELRALSDEKYRSFNAKLVPNVDEGHFIGVKTPELRALAKQLIRDGRAEEFLRELPHEYFEEDQLHAFIISEMKEFKTAAAETDRFLTYVNNWATCDQLLPKVFTKHRQELLPYISRWIASGETFRVRYGIGMLMKHFLGKEFEPSYAEKVAAVTSSEYYVNMMRAWYFAEAMAKQYDTAVTFIEQQKLDKWTHNKAIQKSCESRRVPDAVKVYLRTLRR